MHYGKPQRGFGHRSNMEPPVFFQRMLICCSERTDWSPEKTPWLSLNKALTLIEHRGWTRCQGYGIFEFHRPCLSLVSSVLEPEYLASSCHQSCPKPVASRFSVSYQRRIGKPGQWVSRENVGLLEGNKKTSGGGRGSRKAGLFPILWILLWILWLELDGD